MRKFSPQRYNDVTISSDLILRDIIGITDLRSDKRIDFVGGIRGLGELKQRRRTRSNSTLSPSFTLSPR